MPTTLSKNQSIESAQPSQKATIDSLPAEILVLIFSRLGEKDLASVQLACRTWSSLAQDPYIWKVVANRLRFRLDGSDQPYTQMQKFLRIQWLAEHKHDPEALERMGFWYLDGTRGEENEEKGVRYLKKAARLGQPHSLSYFQEIANDQGDCFNDDSRFSSYSRELMELSLSIFRIQGPGKNLYRDDYYSLGEKFLEGFVEATTYGKSILKKSPEKGLYYLERAAALGDPTAQTIFHPENVDDGRQSIEHFIYMYKKLSRIKKELCSKAILYYHHICTYSDPKYQVKGYYLLGQLFYSAKGPFFKDWTQEKSGQQAAFYFQRGVALNINNEESALCRFMLGKLHLEGRGVEPSYERAVGFFEQAATFRLRNLNRPQNEAPFYLGELHEKGIGVTQSFEKAIEYYLDFIKFDRSGEPRKTWLNLVKAYERLGHFYQEGLGVEKNERKALACISTGKQIQKEMQTDIKIMSELSEIAIQKIRKRKREEVLEASILEPPSKRKRSELEEDLGETSTKRKRE